MPYRKYYQLNILIQGFLVSILILVQPPGPGFPQQMCDSHVAIYHRDYPAAGLSQCSNLSGLFFLNRVKRDPRSGIIHNVSSFRALPTAEFSCLGTFSFENVCFCAHLCMILEEKLVKMVIKTSFLASLNSNGRFFLVFRQEFLLEKISWRPNGKVPEREDGLISRLPHTSRGFSDENTFSRFTAACAYKFGSCPVIKG